MKRLKAIKACTAKGPRTNSLLDIIIDRPSPIAIVEAEGVPTEEAEETDSDEEATIRQPQDASSSSDAMTAILQQMTALTALVQKKQNDIDRLKQKYQKPENWT